MTSIELSETAEKLLKRIVESRLGSGSGLGLSLMFDCMVEHLIHEEARRRGITDNDMKEEGVFSATVENREKLRKRDLNAGVRGKKVVE